MMGEEKTCSYHIKRWCLGFLEMDNYDEPGDAANIRNPNKIKLKRPGSNQITGVPVRDVVSPS